MLVVMDFFKQGLHLIYYSSDVDDIEYVNYFKGNLLPEMAKILLRIESYSLLGILFCCQVRSLICALSFSIFVRLWVIMAFYLRSVLL